MSTPGRFQALRPTWRSLRRRLLAVAAASGAVNLLLLTPTLYMLQVYDRVLVSQSELTLLAVSLVALACLATMALAEHLRTRLLVGASVRIDAALAPAVFDAALQAARRQPPGAGPRPLADLIELRQFATGAGLLAVLDVPWVVVYVGALALLHPALGVMAVGFAVLQCGVARFGQQRTVAPTGSVALSGEASAAFLRGKMQEADTIEAMGMLGALWRRFLRLQRRHEADETRLQTLTHRLTAVSKFIRYAQQSMALALGALLVIRGELSVGAMIAANVLTTRALAPIDQLVGAWRGVVMARQAAARLDALLADAPPPAPAMHAAVPCGERLLRHVEATAPQGGTPILRGIDLRLAPGSVTAVVGPSGAGKSVLARIVAGAWAPSAGDRLLDGRPYETWSDAARGADTGYLPQEVELFDGTIGENIARLGGVDAERVVAAAHAAGLHETLLRLPRGYDTVIGEGGVTLSAGQQQRIALARAVYGDPSLVVLDEPNANLDEAGEAALATLVRALKAAGRTVLIVTHRPAILAAADRLVVLRDGRIEREGRPEQVVADVRRRAFPASPAPSSSSPPAAPLRAAPLPT